MNTIKKDNESGYQNWPLEALWKDAYANEGFHGEAVFLAIEELKRRGFTKELKEKGFRI